MVLLFEEGPTSGFGVRFWARGQGFGIRVRGGGGGGDGLKVGGAWI